MNLFYREIAPPETLRNIVLSFWEFTAEGTDASPVEHEIFPDGCVSLLFHRNERFKVNRVIFSGLHLKSIVTPVFAGDVFWGLRISPAACAALLQIDPADFRDRSIIDIEAYPHLIGGLVGKIKACRNFAEAVKAYEKHLLEAGFDESRADAVIARAARIIEENKGEIKISELAALVFLSPRQLERRFKRSSGLTPKQFARARRFRATAVDMVENDQENWAARAAQMGYTDQSHLAHEFVSVARRTPNSFAAKVKNIEHGDLVK